MGWFGERRPGLNNLVGIPRSAWVSRTGRAPVFRGFFVCKFGLQVVLLGYPFQVARATSVGPRITRFTAANSITDYPDPLVPVPVAGTNLFHQRSAGVALARILSRSTTTNEAVRIFVLVRIFAFLKWNLDVTRDILNSFYLNSCALKENVKIVRPLKPQLSYQLTSMIFDWVRPHPATMNSPSLYPSSVLGKQAGNILFVSFLISSRPINGPMLT